MTLLDDEVHAGWRLFRPLYALAGAGTWLTRVGQLPGLYSDQSPLVESSKSPIAWPALAVYAWFAVLLAGFAAVAMNWNVRRAAACILVAQVAFRVGSPDYIFMYDQLMLWQTVALLFHPDGAGRTPGSPLGRQLLTLTYVGMYAGTGLSKVARTTQWFIGQPLAAWLVDSHFAGGELARWASVQAPLLAVMGTVTIMFEAGFPLALLHPWTRRAWLLAGIAMHLGILTLLEVHTFSFVALAGYPMLVDGRWAAWLAEKWRGRGRGRR